MTISFGVIGGGSVGQALSSALSKKGHKITMGVRNQPKLESFGKQHPKIKIGSFSEAVKAGEYIIIAIDFDGVDDFIKSVGAEYFKGKVVIEVSVPMTPGTWALKEMGSLGSGIQAVQKWLPEAHVVGCWQSVSAHLMVDPNLSEGKPTMPICGDNADAKAKVTKLLEESGWEALDLGDSTNGKTVESLGGLWVAIYKAKNTTQFALKLFTK